VFEKVDKGHVVEQVFPDRKYPFSQDKHSLILGPEHVLHLNKFRIENFLFINLHFTLMSTAHRSLEPYLGKIY
jgi:hypothetical protein